MPKTTARKLSQLVHSGSLESEGYNSRHHTRMLGGASTSNSGWDTTGGAFSFESPGSKRYGQGTFVGRDSRRSPLATSHDNTSRQLLSPARAIHDLHARFSVPRPDQTKARAAASPVSPPMLPTKLRTHTSLSQFITEDQEWRDEYPKGSRTLFHNTQTTRIEGEHSATCQCSLWRGWQSFSCMS